MPTDPKTALALPSGFEWDLELELGDETARLTRAVWPRFLSEESDLPEPGLSFDLAPDELGARFPNWGIRRASDGELVAHLSGALIAANRWAARLPDRGWHYAIEAAAAGGVPNCLCLLVANVGPEHASRGLSRPLLEQAKVFARARGLDTLIAPVRPSRKAEHPRLPMAEYLALRTGTGEVFDPWVRTHLRSGAELLNVCPDSNVVCATPARWREWTGLALAESGLHLLPQGLATLELDLASDVGVYREPGVWMRYRLT